jgi:hypothetical protein
MEPELYDPDEWPYGLRCMDCGTRFVEGMPIAERLTGISSIPMLVDDEYVADPCFHVEKICVPCGLGIPK